MKLKLIFFIAATPLFLLFTQLVFSQTFTSPSYQIDWGNFNITSGSKSSSNYNLTDTIGQNAPGQFDNNGYTLKSGFQYIYDSFRSDFSFEIDNLLVNLGTLTPGIGSTDSNIITITTPSGQGYQILTFQNHPLSLASGVTIPDTTCDTHTCSESVSGVWTNGATYGFGFNASGINHLLSPIGIGTSQHFPDSSYFRQFANSSATPPETSQIIMSEDSPVEQHSARITYKANISPLQSAGNYSNSITFIAVPKY